MATHSSTLAWKVPWMEEPDGLQSMGSQRVRHNSATSLSFFSEYCLNVTCSEKPFSIPQPRMDTLLHALIVSGTLPLGPRWDSGKESACQCRRCWFDTWVQKIPGEGNSNPFQYSCLGNPMDRGAWRASVHSVTESATTEHAHNNALLLDLSVVIS